MIGEPIVGLIVVAMVRVEQGHQNVDVQQTNHQSVNVRSSSLRRLTTSRVTIRVPFRGESRGTPFRISVDSVVRRSERLANSEITFPMETRCIAASSLAVSSTSSSMSSVVLMPQD